jgi:4-hydroxy-tetrahydrodipicolinate reductase
MRIGLFGTGRLGSAIKESIMQASDLELAWQVDMYEVPPSKADVAIEATVADAVPARVAWALETGTNLVVGTTGWTMPELREIVADRIGVMISPNFSLTVALMARFSRILGRYTARDEERDPYVFEHHHRKNLDAPSGTAKRLADAVLEGCPRKTQWAMGASNVDQLDIAVLRAGSEFGRHTVGFDSPFETLEITHRARSRRVFAEGAVEAARYLNGRKGLYTMDDLAASVLDPLFDR